MYNDVVGAEIGNSFRAWTPLKSLLAVTDNQDVLKLGVYDDIDSLWKSFFKFDG